MGPREKAKNEILRSRQDIAFRLGVTSTHWPQYFRYRLGAGMVDHGDFELNETQKRLVGYPRNWLQEAWWQMKHEFGVSVGELCVVSGFVGALSAMFLSRRAQRQSKGKSQAM